MSLNPEPAAPREREIQHLPPKSYADAAEEGLEHEKHDTKDTEQFEGAGQDSSPKRTTKGHRRSASGRSSGGAHKHSDRTNGDVYEKHDDGDGQRLTSVKPADAYEKGHKGNGSHGKPKRRNSELKSGRQAGAGWHKSKYGQPRKIQDFLSGLTTIAGTEGAKNGIRFAPLNVPLQRRLQTLAVLMHTLSIVGLLATFFFLCTNPILWPILLPYLIYVLFSNAGTSGELSFRSDWARGLRVWSLFASYFPARLHRSQELEPTRKYVFGYHPHGIISHGAFAAFATEALGFSQLFPGITNSLLTLESNFRYPLYREYALRLGLASVSRESITNTLTKGGQNGEGMGRAVTVVVGGAREALEAQPGRLGLILNCRKGFIKMAIRTGADLVPVLAFGENDLYDQLDAKSHPYIHKFQLLVKKVMGFTVPFFHARGVFNYDVGMMPYRRPLNIVVGRPIRVVQDPEPDKDYLNEVHGKYVEELVRIWNAHKDEFAPERTEELRIIE